MSNFPTSIRIAKVRDWAILPSRKHEDDAGLDLFFCPEQNIHSEYGWQSLNPRNSDHPIVGTGIAVAIPKGIVGIVTRCSGTLNGVEVGVIDAGYTGEIMVRLGSKFDLSWIDNGKKIAQLLLIPIWTPNLHEIQYDEFPKTERGANGGIVNSYKDIG
jgi:dUTP pyrophosphatase